MTISLGGYNGTVTIGGTDGTKISSGTTALGGNQSNPLTTTVKQGSTSAAVPFAIRLAKDAGDTFPDISKITVSAEGDHADKWAFAKTNITNVASQCVLTKSGSLSINVGDYTPSGMMVVLGKLTDGIIDASCPVFTYDLGSLIFTLPATKTVTGVVVKSVSAGTAQLAQGLQLLCDGVVKATLGTAITVLSGTWSPTLVPTNCNVVTIKAGAGGSSNFISEVEIYVEVAPSSTDYTAYGTPLVILNRNLVDTNMMLFAKCKALDTDTEGNDTSVKIKVIAE